MHTKMKLLKALWMKKRKLNTINLDMVQVFNYLGKLKMESLVNTLENGIQMNKLEMDIVYFLMEVNIEDFKLKEYFMDRVCTGGQQKKDQNREIIIRALGQMEKCMAKENSNIKMVIQLKEHLSIIYISHLKKEESFF